MRSGSKVFEYVLDPVEGLSDRLLSDSIELELDALEVSDESESAESRWRVSFFREVSILSLRIDLRRRAVGEMRLVKWIGLGMYFCRWSRPLNRAESNAVFKFFWVRAEHSIYWIDNTLTLALCLSVLCPI